MTSSHNLLRSAVAHHLNIDQCQQECTAPSQPSVVQQSIIGETRPANVPVEGVRFPQGWCETMTRTQHDSDALSDVGSDTSPCRIRPKCKWLWCIFTKIPRNSMARSNTTHMAGGPAHPGVSSLTNTVGSIFRRRTSTSQIYESCDRVEVEPFKRIVFRLSINLELLVSVQPKLGM
jgi:hypothetical protein